MRSVQNTGGQFSSCFNELVVYGHKKPSKNMERKKNKKDLK